MTLLLGGMALVVPAGGADAQEVGHAGKGIVISTAKNSSEGTYLVSGTALYTLKPSKVACTAACLKIWPEVLLPRGVTKATAGAGVEQSKLGTLKHSGGALQVTYGGKPLYWYRLDKSPGQVRGDVTDAWGKWSAYLTAQPTGAGSGSVTTTTVAGGGGTGGVAF